jgi:hypothetical protein
MNAEAWKGHHWRLVYGPKDLETGPRQCVHAQRNPKLRHLPLPKAGLLVRVLAKDGREYCRESARSRANADGVINLVPQGRESA